MENHFICNGYVFITWKYEVVGDSYVLQNAKIYKVSNEDTVYKRDLGLNSQNEVVLPIGSTMKIEWK